MVQGDKVKHTHDLLLLHNHKMHSLTLLIETRLLANLQQTQDTEERQLYHSLHTQQVQFHQNAV